MENKCLVKKYEGIVGNKNIPYFDCVVIGFPDGTEVTRYMVISKSTSSVVLKSDQPVFSGNYTLELPQGSGTPSVSIDACNVPFSISVIGKTHGLVVFNMQNAPESTMILEQFKYAEELTKIDFRSSHNSGDILSLGYMKSITALIMPYAAITGTIENMVKTFIHNYPNENKTLSLNLNRTGGGSHTVTFNNVILKTAGTTCKIVFNNGTASVYSVANSTDTLLGTYNGSTWSYA